MSESLYQLNKTELRLLVFSSTLLISFLYFNDGWIVHPDSETYASYLEVFGEGADKSKLNLGLA